jgi:hypothetical protein
MENRFSFEALVKLAIKACVKLQGKERLGMAHGNLQADHILIMKGKVSNYTLVRSNIVTGRT